LALLITSEFRPIRPTASHSARWKTAKERCELDFLRGIPREPARGGGFSAKKFSTGIFQEQPMAGKEIYNKMKDKVTGNGRGGNHFDICFWLFSVCAT
jgi:hypothetical protein